MWVSERETGDGQVKGSREIELDQGGREKKWEMRGVNKIFKMERLREGRRKLVTVEEQ